LKRLLLFLVLSVLVLGGCGRVSPAAGVKVAGPLLPDGERTDYVILNAGREIGTLSMTVRHVVFQGTPAYELDIVAKTRDGSVETVDSSLVFVTRDSMVALTTFRFIVTGDAITTTAANYGDSAVAVSAYAQGNERQQLLPMDPRTYDADQLVVLGRVIQIKGRQPVDIRVLSPMGPPLGGNVFEGRISPAGEEVARVPAGSIGCTKLFFEFEHQKFTVWYEKTGAHRMVRYLTGDGDMEMQLVVSRP